MFHEAEWVASTKSALRGQALEADSSNIWEHFRVYADHVSSTASRKGSEPKVVDRSLHLLWDIMLQGARNLSPESFGQYHMIYTLARLRELGAPWQTMDNAKQRDDDKAENHWTGLPYLFEDVKAEWEDNATWTETEKTNLVSFLAKMLAVGTCAGRSSRTRCGYPQQHITSSLGIAYHRASSNRAHVVQVRR